MSAESSRSQKHSCLNCMKCKNRTVDREGFSTSHKLLRDNARCFQRSTSYKHKHFCWKTRMAWLGSHQTFVSQFEQLQIGSFSPSVKGICWSFVLRLAWLVYSTSSLSVPSVPMSSGHLSCSHFSIDIFIGRATIFAILSLLATLWPQACFGQWNWKAHTLRQRVVRTIAAPRGVVSRGGYTQPDVKRTACPGRVTLQSLRRSSHWISVESWSPVLSTIRRNNVRFLWTSQYLCLETNDSRSGKQSAPRKPGFEGLPGRTETKCDHALGQIWKINPNQDLSSMSSWNWFLHALHALRAVASPPQHAEQALALPVLRWHCPKQAGHTCRCSSLHSTVCHFLKKLPATPHQKVYPHPAPLDVCRALFAQGDVVPSKQFLQPVLLHNCITHQLQIYRTQGQYLLSTSEQKGPIPDCSFAEFGINTGQNPWLQGLLHWPPVAVNTGENVVAQGRTQAASFSKSFCASGIETTDSCEYQDKCDHPLQRTKIPIWPGEIWLKPRGFGMHFLNALFVRISSESQDTR